MARHGHGRGSTKPANVKLRPAIPVEERAQPRKKLSSTGHNLLVTAESDKDETSEDETDGHEMTFDEKKPLEGMTVCLTGMTEVSKEDVRRMVWTLGGKLDGSLVLETAFLIADKTGGDKYRAAIQNGIPVIHSRFVKQLHQEWTDASADIDVANMSENWRLPPLTGCTVCLTGYDDNLDARAALSEKICHLGGADYTVALSENGKYKAAVQLNRKRIASNQSIIQIVWGEWVEHSLYAFGKMSEENYLCKVVTDRGVLATANLTRTSDIFARVKNSLGKRNTRNDRQSRLLQSETIHDLAVEADAPPSKKRKVDGGPAASTYTGNLLLNADATVRHSMPAEFVDDGANDIEIIAGPVETAAIRKASLSVANNALAGRNSGLLRSKSSVNLEISRIQDLLAPPSVAPSSSKEKGRASSSSSSSSSLSSLASVATTSLPMADPSLLRNQSRIGKLVKPASSVATAPSTSRSALVVKASVSPPVPLQTPSNQSDDSSPAQLFEGKVFQLQMGDVSSRMIDSITVAIRARGGRLQNTSSSAVDYILCRFLQLSEPAFDVDDPRLVTDMWLEYACAFDEYPEEQYYSLLTRKPLLLDHQRPDLSGMCVSLAGFDPVTHCHVLKVCQALGMAHSVNTKRGVTTHLVIASPTYQSTRLAKIQEWGIEVMFPSHLRELVDKSCSGLATNSVLATAAIKAQQHQADVRLDDPEDVADVPYPRLRKDDTPATGDGPLVGCVICISSQISIAAQAAKSYKQLAIDLGATISSSTSDPTTTHFVFESKKSKDQKKEFKLALESSKHIVHPTWLDACREKGARQPEIAFKHTLDTNRTLCFDIASTSKPRITASEHYQRQAALPPDGEDLGLPPPLLPAPSQSTPRYSRLRRTSSLPENPSSGSVPLSPTRQADWIAVPPIGALDDSGFASSPPKRPLHARRHPSSPQAASQRHAKQQRLTSNVELETTERKAGVHPPSPTKEDEGFSQKTTAVNMMLEQMNALLKDMPVAAGAAPSVKPHTPVLRTSLNRCIRRMPRKTDDTGSSPGSLEASRSMSFLDAGLQERQENGYDALLESQLGRHHLEETQDGLPDEQSMIIRIKDPAAEAARAQLLEAFGRSAEPKAMAKQARPLQKAESLPSTNRGSEQTPSSRRSLRQTQPSR